MYSINSNHAAVTAMNALAGANRTISSLHSHMSTGLRISEASHNAAYWSISTTMRSDVKALGSVSDSIAFSSALVDVAYEATKQVEQNLSQINERLVLAQDPGVDCSKIQTEIDQLIDQTFMAVSAASFGGFNLLATDVGDLWEADFNDRTQKFVSAFNRTSDGVTVRSMDVDLLMTSMTNASGGGILDADPRSPHTIGGIRRPAALGEEARYDQGVSYTRGHGALTFDFAGPFTLQPGQSLTFDITVDAESPNHGLPGPLHPGIAYSISVSRADIDALYPHRMGVISDWREMAHILNTALSGTGAYALVISNGMGGLLHNKISIGSRETLPLDGSSVNIENITAPNGTGGITNGVAYGSAPATIDLKFEPFKIYRDVSVSMKLGLNNGYTLDVTLDRDTVDNVLGKTDGRVDNIGEFWDLLTHLFGSDPRLSLTDHGDGTMNMRINVQGDRSAGHRTDIGFRQVVVNIEPIPQIGLRDIDVAERPALAREFLNAVQAMHRKTVNSASYLGAVKKRLDIQANFTSQLVDSLNRGVGQLVDAEMDKISAKLVAAQSIQELAIKALGIANSSPQNILQLFRS